MNNKKFEDQPNTLCCNFDPNYLKIGKKMQKSVDIF